MAAGEPTGDAAKLPDLLFEPLATRIAKVSGIRIPRSKRWLLAARVAERMGAIGADSTSAYVKSVLEEAGGLELGQLVEAVRVGETQFFRHKAQLRAIRRVALPEIVARRERGRERLVRVWSAGCATGEEPYTLAMMLEDALPKDEGFKFSILATDLSERALEVARRGRYPISATTGVPEETLRWAVEPESRTMVRIAHRVRRAVRFEQRNLLDRDYPMDFDLILCRNVLIYFDRATQREVLARLSASVVAGGYLALGYAERLSDDDRALTPIRTEDGIIYRRGHRPAMPTPQRPLRRDRVASKVSSAPPDKAPEPVAEESPEPEPAPPALSGELSDEAGRSAASRAVRSVLSHDKPTVDLRELAFADEGVARVLQRAARTLEAEGRPLTVIAEASGMVRFLRRHGIVPPAKLRSRWP